MKRAPGGLIDCEFVAQTLQLVSAPSGGPLHPSVRQAFSALAEEGRLERADADTLLAGWALQQSLAQLMRAALDRRSDPSGEPAGFQARLAGIAGVCDLNALQDILAARRSAVRAVFERLIGAVATERPPSAV